MAQAQLSASAAALDLLAEIEADHGPVLFHISGGCCDGTAPMVYPAGEFRIGTHDVHLGDVGQAPVWTSAAQAAAWAHGPMLIDVAAGRGAAFSLDNPRDRHFVLRAPLCAA